MLLSSSQPAIESKGIKRRRRIRPLSPNLFAFKQNLNLLRAVLWRIWIKDLSFVSAVKIWVIVRKAWSFRCHHDEIDSCDDDTRLFLYTKVAICRRSWLRVTARVCPRSLTHKKDARWRDRCDDGISCMPCCLLAAQES
jgi:hypothetical protein